jgi:alpha-tubulin suppressor-like RCC1 family protein
LFADGSVQCWGIIYYGEVGDGTPPDSETLVPLDARVTVVGLERAVQLALSSEMCARLDDGTARCWNYGFGVTPAPIAGLAGVTQIIAGAGNNTCAVLDTGTATCWYGNQTPVVVEGLSGIVQYASGVSHSCAVLSDGTVWCWGVNSEGELGNGTQVSSTTPVQVKGITGAKQVALGYGHSCARLGDGTVWCWGYDYARELAFGSTQHFSFTLQATQVPGLSGVQDIAAGTNHTCARLGDGSVWCWGQDLSSELGNGPSSVVCLPHDQPVIQRASFLFAGGNTSCVLDGNLGLACWGQVAQPPDTHSSPVTIALSQTPSPGAIAAGDEHICLIRTDRTVACWGNDLAGQLGDGQAVLYVDAQHPVTVTGLDQVSALSLGQGFSCALRLDGTVVCWGGDNYGQTGDSSPTWPNLPNTIPGLANVTAVQAGARHVCAILADRTVVCWGENLSGQLGPGDAAVMRTTPLAVPGLSGVVALAAGSSHTCALLDTQRVACWGDDRSGQLGVATPSGSTSIATPTLVAGLDHVVAVAAGNAHTCALLADGTVRCWGAGSEGELGDGLGADRFSPAQVSGLTNVVQIALGSDQSCARLGDGTIRCWGGNDSGQVGAGFTPLQPTPVRVQGLP